MTDCLSSPTEQAGTPEAVAECTTTTATEADRGSSSPDAQAPEVAPWVREFFRCKRWIESALATSPIRLCTVRDVFDAILDGRAFLWPGPNCCHVVEITTVFRRRVCIAWLAGGDLSELLAMTPNIERWAREEMECEVALVTGRRGWLRPLAASGYTELHTTLGKDLRNA